MKREAGFTLIEVLLALGLLGIFLASVPSALTGINRATIVTTQRNLAENLARNQIDSVQTQPYDNVHATPVYALISDVPASYDLVLTAVRLDPRGDGITNDDGLQEITVDVQYNSKIIFTLVDYKLDFKP